MTFNEEHVKNNGRKVRLLAETQIEDSYGERQIMRHAGYGRIFIDEQSFGIFYIDTQGTEQNGIYLYGTENCVRMERSGSARGVLEFSPGEETLSRYYLEYGDIEISIRTFGIECELGEKEGRVTLSYSSGMNGEAENRTLYTCRWKS